MQHVPMQHASIVAFLSGTLPPEALAVEIAAEVVALNEAIRMTAQGNIFVSNGPEFLVTKDGARRLLQAVADDRLPYDAAMYVTDCIVMNDDFCIADDATREALFFIEDDSERHVSQNVNWRPSREETLAALALLG